LGIRLEPIQGDDYVSSTPLALPVNNKLGLQGTKTNLFGQLVSFLEEFARDKHSSLLQTIVNFEKKVFLHCSLFAKSTDIN
jgi:hypothetical protein